MSVALQLRISDLGVRYGDIDAVVGFGEVVEAGQWLCLIGPNGAGKSSVLRSIAGLVAYRGGVLIDGDDTAHWSQRRRAATVAYVPQHPVLPTEMTTWEYVLLGRSPYIGYFSNETRHDREVVGEVLERLALVEFATRRLRELSGGEQQRVVIARALAQQARVLLLDEATSALDIGHQQQALELVDELRTERGLVVVSAMHDLTLAGLYADRLDLLYQGHSVCAGSAAEVLRPETLGEFYGVRVTVHHDDDGTVVVVPRRHLDDG